MNRLLLLLSTVATASALGASAAEAHDPVCGQASRAARSACHRGYVAEAGKSRYDVRSGHGKYIVSDVRATWAMCGPHSFCGSFLAGYVRVGFPGGWQDCGRIKVRINAHTGRPVRFRGRVDGRWVTLTDKTAC